MRLSNFIRLEIPKDKFPIYLFENILNEYHNNIKNLKEIIHGLLEALFGKILQIKEENSIDTKHHQSTYEQFINLLLKECPRLHIVKEFAYLLNTTPQNLNIVCC